MINAKKKKKKTESESKQGRDQQWPAKVRKK